METTTRAALFQLGTLCFVLLMLIAAAHGEAELSGVVIVLEGTARCKSTRTINNATLQVTINGTTVATSETNSSGQFLLVANITSESQLLALARNEANITAPAGTCGGGSGSDDDYVEVEIADLQIMVPEVVESEDNQGKPPIQNTLQITLDSHGNIFSNH